MSKPGTPVLALRDIRDGKMYVYGEGVFLGDLPVPVGTQTPFGVLTEGVPFRNPCIKLNSGHIVWGCQCWWGPPDEMRKRFAGCEEILVDAEELKNPPLEVGTHEKQ